jgi:hypothetical protein
MTVSTQPLAVLADTLCHRRRHGRREIRAILRGTVRPAPWLAATHAACFREAFGALERWTDNGKTPPTSRFVPRDPAVDLVNTCDL